VPAEALTIADGVVAARNGAGKKLTFAEASAVQAAIANAIFNALGVCTKCRSPGAG